MKQNAITVSVVIPAYNEEKNIEKTINSILLQTLKPDEIIVVNNSSTDKTGEIAGKKGVRVIHENVRGISSARNAGFNAARGDILVRCDADTIVPTNWIQEIKNSFTNNSVVAVTGPTDYFADDFPTWVAYYFGFVQNVLYFRLSRFVLGYHVLLGLNCAIRKTVWEKILNEVCVNDKIMHEDMDLSIHAHRYGKIVYTPTLRVQSSLRRLHKPISLFIEYPIKWLSTIIIHAFIHTP